jgi:oxidoreductase
VNLVTGASGFLGGHLVDALVARGAPVRTLVRASSERARLQKLGVELSVGCLEDADSIDRAMAGVERVFHCAAVAADFGSWDVFRAANVTGVRHLLHAAQKAAVTRFVHVSTSDVYGHPNTPADERAPLRRRGWPYGDTKIEGEEIVWKAHRESGIPITIVRPVSIYGPRSASFVL